MGTERGREDYGNLRSDLVDWRRGKESCPENETDRATPQRLARSVNKKVYAMDCITSSISRTEPFDCNALTTTAITLNEQYGWNVFPVKADKTPACKWKALQTQKLNATSITELFQSSTNATGIAVIHGEISDNHVIRDFDNKEAYYVWRDGHKELAERLPTVITQRGYHVHHRSKANYAIMDDGEYRSTSKQYSLIPPSFNGAWGQQYEWLIAPQQEIPYVSDPVQYGLLRTTPVPLVPTRVRYKHSNTSSPLNNNHLSCPALEIHYVSDNLNYIILNNLPTGVGQRHHRLLDLVRAVKQLRSDWSEPELESIFIYWWNSAKLVVRTKERMISWQDFRIAYDGCRVFHRGLPLNLIELEPIPVDLPRRYKSLNAMFVVKTCSFLQNNSVGGTFWLAGEALARSLGLKSPKRIYEVLRWMCDDGLLERQSKGNNLKERASVYRYLAYKTRGKR